MKRTLSIALLAALAPLTAAVLPASAAESTPDWHTTKCRRYAKAWEGALAHLGRQGLGDTFLAHHAAFLASGCTRRADVCPVSEQELKLANIMVILSMNAGTASTFPPFACPK